MKRHIRLLHACILRVLFLAASVCESERLPAENLETTRQKSIYLVGICPMGTLEVIENW